MTAPLDGVRAALAGAKAKASARRAAVARLVGFGATIDPAELVALCPTPEAVDELERDARRWARMRELVQVVAELPRLQGERAKDVAEAAERYERLEAEWQRLRVEAMSNPALAGQAAEAHLQRDRAVPSRELGERLHRAQAAWQELLALLPEDRRARHEKRERALGRAADRVRRAKARAEELEARPRLERVRERLAQLAAGLAELAVSARSFVMPHHGEDVQRAMRLEAAADRHVTSIGTAANGMEGERARLLAEQKRLESPEHAATEAEARAELEAAEAELAAIAAEPELLEEVLAEFADYEAEAAASKAPPVERPARAKAR